MLRGKLTEWEEMESNRDRLMGQPEEEALSDCSDSPENWELPQRGTGTEGTKKKLR